MRYRKNLYTLRKSGNAGNGYGRRIRKTREMLNIVLGLRFCARLLYTAFGDRGKDTERVSYKKRKDGVLMFHDVTGSLIHVFFSHIVGTQIWLF